MTILPCCRAALLDRSNFLGTMMARLLRISVFYQGTGKLTAFFCRDLAILAIAQHCSFPSSRVRGAGTRLADTFETWLSPFEKRSRESAAPSTIPIRVVSSYH